MEFYISANFVTVTKSDAIEWTDVVMELREFIKDYLNEEGMVIIRDEFLNEAEEEKSRGGEEQRRTS